MKKNMMRVVNTNSISKFFKTAVFVLALGGSYATSYATPAPYSIENPGTGFGKAVVNHIGSDDESLLFEVKLDNTTGEKFSVIVKDEAKNTIYRGWFSDKEFNRKFRVPKSESSKVTFIIRSESGKAYEAFEINSSRRIVEDVVVKKVL